MRLLVGGLIACMAIGTSAARAARSRPAKPGAGKAAFRRPAPVPRGTLPAHVPPAPPELLFTFDDGPHLERTPRVLKILAQHHIRAVFFVNGVHFQGASPSAEQARALLREEIAAGHAVGNHTIHHKFLCGKLGPRIAGDEIEGNARLIEEAIGRRPELYRTPYGAHCPTLSTTLARLGLKHTGWDIDPQDWKVLNTARVRDYVTRYLHNLKSGRRILLLHDIHEDTVEALPQILDFLERENAERAKRGEPQIRIVDYAYLLPPHPAVPAILEGIGRILIGRIAGPAAGPLYTLLIGKPHRS